jgi:uncharacterized protein (TIGR02147 family)
MPENRSSTAYRLILQEEFKRRAGRNPRYSIRAYAKTLKMSPAHLSRIMRGERGLSLQLAERISDCLQFSLDRRQKFCDLVEAAHSRTPLRRSLARRRLLTSQRHERLLGLDVFQAISGWHHGAIRELVLTDGFQNDPAWIADRLGIDVSAARTALERLIRLGLLTRDPDGTLRTDDKMEVKIPDGISSEAVRKFHSQILLKASDSVNSQPVSDRFLSSSLIRFDTNRLPKASQAIQDVRRSFLKKADQGGKSDSVYCFSVQFFRVDSQKKGKST